MEVKDEICLEQPGEASTFPGKFLHKARTSNCLHKVELLTVFDLKQQQQQNISRHSSNCPAMSGVQSLAIGCEKP